MHQAFFKRRKLDGVPSRQDRSNDPAKIRTMVALGKRFDNQNGHRGMLAFFIAAENAVIVSPAWGKSKSMVFSKRLLQGA
jgi:hypothetical protein